MMRNVTLDQLVAGGGMSETIASLLSAAVRARLGIVVSGGKGAGKTTLLRALCAEIGPGEVIGTFETDYELLLHEQAEERHALVHAWSAGAELDGSRQTAEQALGSFRFRLDRGILGEVGGAEVKLMATLMEAGACPMSTTQAATARQAVERLIAGVIQTDVQISPRAAASKVAQAVHLVVQLACDVVGDPDDPSKARERRYVDEIVEVLPGENEAGYATNVIFRRRAGECAVAAMPPDRLMDRLVAHGIDADAFAAEVRANRQPRGL